LYNTYIINIPNIVLKSALRSHADGFSVAHINPGSFVKNADRILRVFAETIFHPITVSEIFFKVVEFIMIKKNWFAGLHVVPER
jgi:hypothetical protein